MRLALFWAGRPRPYTKNMRWFASNIRTFLLAFVLGVSVWLSAVTGADPDEVRAYPNPIPLEVIGQDASLVLTSEIPATIEVTLRAPRSVWEQLTAQENSVSSILDISGLSAGEHTQAVQIQIDARPVQIVLATPETVTFTLEASASRTLPIDLSLSGQPAIGYQAGDVLFDPLQVAISGPESIVRKAVRARVLVSLDGARESMDQAIPVEILDADNALIEGISVNPDSVQVTVPVSQQGGFRDVAVKVVVLGQVADGYRLENISVFPPVVTLFSEDPALVNSLPGVVETQILDLQDASENISTRLALNLPVGVTVVGEQVVLIEADVSPIESSLTLSNRQIEVVGLSEGIIIQVLPQAVDVIISGPLPVLDALTAQDVRVIADVNGLSLGTHQVTLQVEVLVANVLVESILPGTVEVVLSAPGIPTPTSTPRP